MEPVSFVTLGVRDLESSAHFYERLGRTVERRFGGRLGYMACGPLTVVLCPWPLLEAELGLSSGSSAAWGGPSLLSCNVPGRDDVDAAAVRARDAGAELLVGPCDRAWGGRSAVFTDPDGHRWEIVWNPAYST